MKETLALQLHSLARETGAPYGLRESRRLGVPSQNGDRTSFRGTPGFAEGVMVMFSKLHQKKILARAIGNASPASGFTLIEVMVSMMITLIVMSAVFGLLSRGQSTFQREPEIADMQQSARAALDIVTKDAIQAGAGLPPEFPAFSTTAMDVNVGDGGADPDEIVIMGSLGGSFQTEEPTEVDPTSFGGDLTSCAFKTAGDWSDLEIGDLVVLYDNLPLSGYWIMGYVRDAQPDGLGQMDITVEPDPPAGNEGGPVLAEYQSRDVVAVPVGFQPTMVTAISVVRYYAEPDPSMVESGPPPNRLMREVNFAAQGSPVAYLEDFQVVYLVGGTDVANEQDDPPDPQPTVTVDITAAEMVNGVRVTVSARSLSQNLQGSTEGATAADGNFIRKTFSSNVNPRNIASGLAFRTAGSVTGPVYN